MQIQQIERKKSKYIIHLEDKEFIFAPFVCEKYNIREGQFDGRIFYQAKEESDKILAKKILYDMIERVEKSKAGFLDSLTDKGIPYPVALQAVEEAEQKGFIDDRRFAECYLHTHKGSRGWYRLAQELKFKGVSEEIIASFREEYGDRSEECLHYARIFLKHLEPTYENKQKVYARLARKGFSNEEIKNAFSLLQEEYD